MADEAKIKKAQAEALRKSTKEAAECTSEAEPAPSTVQAAVPAKVAHKITPVATSVEVATEVVGVTTLAGEAASPADDEVGSKKPRYGGTSLLCTSHLLDKTYIASCPTRLRRQCIKSNQIKSDRLLKVFMECCLGID